VSTECHLERFVRKVIAGRPDLVHWLKETVANPSEDKAFKVQANDFKKVIGRVHVLMRIFDWKAGQPLTTTAAI